MTEICFLGTGGWVPTLERDNMSFLVNQDQTLSLVDCSGSVIQKIKKLGFNPAEIQSILVTHIHPDHIFGLPSLIHSLMLEEALIHLHGSWLSMEFCQNFLDLFGLRDKKVRCRVEFHPQEPGKSFSLSPHLLCTPFPVPHHPSSLAFLFHFKKEKIRLFYSGDTPLHPPLFEEARGVDFLIHECCAPQRYFKKYPGLAVLHTDSLGLGRLAQEAEVKCLIPCHFFSDLDYSISEIREEIAKNFKGRVAIPQDFERINLI